MTRTVSALASAVPIALIIAAGGGDGASAPASGAQPTTTAGQSSADGSPTAPRCRGSASGAGPAFARRYVDAVNRDDLDGLVAAFASSGLVIDVARNIRGHDADRPPARR